MDILCQAKSGMGKTAVFVLATMQQLEPVDGQVSVLVMCHTRELAFQISKEYERFSKFLPAVKVRIVFNSWQRSQDALLLKLCVFIPLQYKRPCRFGWSLYDPII